MVPSSEIAIMGMITEAKVALSNAGIWSFPL